jgi:hypothetical protein
MEFPAYRKYSNNRNFFKIINASSLEEVQVVADKRFVRITEAQLYPERMFIQDLLNCVTDHIVAITEAEYGQQRAQASAW